MQFSPAYYFCPKFLLYTVFLNTASLCSALDRCSEFQSHTNELSDDYYNDGGSGDNLSLVILSMISFSLEINAMNYTILSVLCGFSMFILANHKYFNV